MTKTKSTKRALLSSVLALFLCVAMLVGTTFAWFTDSVTSANNIIKSGNLDVEFEYWNGKEWKLVKDASDILTNELWEPGVTEVAYLRVTNKGSLALKYRLGVNIVEETPGKNVDGDTFWLSDYIYFDVADGQEPSFADRDEAMEIATETKKISAGYAKASAIEAKAADATEYPSEYIAMVVYMPTTVGNVANHDGTNVPEIKLGINVVATQDTVEADSFDEYYDGGATWLGGVDTDWYFENPDATEFKIGSAEELAGLAAIVNGALEGPSTYAMNTTATVNDTFAGKTITLASDIDLDNIPWIPVGRIGTSSTDFTYSFKGTFDGQNHTVYNLDVDAYGWAGLFGIAHGAEINNLKVDGVSIKANRMAGAIVGQLYGSIDNCHVENADIKVVPNAVGTSYDNGDKVGGIVGWIGDNGNNRTLTNCSATDVKIGAYRDVGGIAGYVASSTFVSGNKVDKLTIAVDQLSYHYGNKDPNAGAIYGRTGGAIKEDANTQTSDVSIESTITEGGITYVIDGVTSEKRLYLVPADYEGDTVKVPEGVDAIGNYAFAYNTNVKTVVLASTVTDLGRGFDSSTVEKVVLNEGLTTISSRAFRKTYNLKELVISSTVETVADNAFQSSAIKNIVFPKNVKYIGDSCFTAATVETVTIMGDNVEIAHFAFRDCPKLTTVTILSDRITLGDGMIFTNSQSNNQDPNNITIYVTNDDVKAAIVANGTFKGVIKDMNAVVEDGNVSGALTDGADTIYLTAGTYTLPASNISAGDTIICADGTVFERGASLNINGATIVGGSFENLATHNTINGTFKDCTFSGSNALRYGYAGDTVVFENCVFDGDVYGAHIDSGASEVIFRNCTFSGFNAMGGAITKLTMEGCTFKALGNSNYNGINLWGDAELTNCTFVFDGSVDYEWVDLVNDNKTVTFTNCVVTDGTTETPLKNVVGNYGDNNTIIIDGVFVVNDADGLANAVAKGATNIWLADGEYDVKNCGGKTLTISGSKNAILKIMNEGESGADYGFKGSTVTFNGVTVDTSANTGSYKGYAYMKATFNDCAFIGGGFTTYDVTSFNNCTFDLAGYIWTWGATEVCFTECTFIGDSRTVLAHGSANTVITIKDCDFAATTKGHTGAGDWTAVVEIDPTGTNTYTIRFEGENTLSENYPGWTRVKDGSIGHIVTGLN